MKFKYIVLLSFVTIVNSNPIFSNIPVKVIYDRPQILRAVEQENNEKDVIYNSNSGPNDLIQEESELRRAVVENSDPLEEEKNKQENVVNTKFFAPETVPIQFGMKILPEKSGDLVLTEELGILRRNLDERPQLSPEELLKADKFAQILDETFGRGESEKDNPQLQRVSTNTKNNLEEELKAKLEADEVFGTKKILLKTNEFSRYEEAKQIIFDGIASIRNSIDGIRGSFVNEEQWSKLNRTLENVFTNALKSERINVVKNILPEFQATTSEFISELRQSNATNEQPGFPQNIISIFQNGFQQIQSALGGLGSTTPGSGAADTEVTSSRPNPIQAIQSAISQFQQGISNLNPFNQQTSQAPNTQNDPEAAGQGTTTQRAPLQAIQNAFGQFQQGISNLNPFRPTQKPGSQSDEPSTQNSLVQAFQNASNQFSQAVNNLNPFNRPASGAQNDEGSTTRRPFQGVQNAINQFGQAINNLNPFNQGSTTAKPETAQNTLNTSKPVADNGARPAANQVQNAEQNQNGFNTNRPTLPPAGILTSASSVSLQPVSSGSIIQSPGSQLQGVQSTANRVNPGFSTIKPSRSSPSVIPADTPVQLTAGVVPFTDPAANYQVEIIPSPGVELEEIVGGDLVQPQLRNENIVEMFPSIEIEVNK